MFGSKVKEIKPEPDYRFSDKDYRETRNYLVRELRDYLDIEPDTTVTPVLCQIVDALYKLENIQNIKSSNLIEEE